MAFPKGTQPDFTLTFGEYDLTEATNIHVTFTSGSTKITKSGEDLDVSAHQIVVYMTQEESLSLAVGQLKIQANWIVNGRRKGTDVSYDDVTQQTYMEMIGNENNTDDSTD